MSYDPDIHRRQSTRLQGYDYRSAGAYFVTVCTHQRECFLGEVADGAMRLNDIGDIVKECWSATAEHFPDIALDVFVVMPNHMHGVFLVNDIESPVGARHASPDCGLPGSGGAQTRATHASPLHGPGPKRRSVGGIVGSFKSAATRRINGLRATPGCPVWQRNYYEHVIRGEKDLEAIRRYIADNPMKWHLDENHPTRL